MGALTTQDVGAKFAELVCADPQWLDAEFHALVSAAFGAPPSWPRPPAPPRVPPRDRPPSTFFRAARTAKSERTAPPLLLRRRCHQRSPPP